MILINRAQYEKMTIKRPDACMIANDSGNKSFNMQVQEYNTKHCNLENV